jgi:hypothetical protein
MKPEVIRVHIQMTDDGRMFAIGADEQILARGEHIADLRQNVDKVVRQLYGDKVRIALMVGKEVTRSS